MNPFAHSLNKVMAKHTVPVVYTKVNTAVYDTDTGLVTKTSTALNIKAYPKQIQANQYNYPKLIGKEVILFYISAVDCVPSVDDTLVYNSKTYLVDSYQEHSARGEILLYRVLTTKV